MHRYIFPVLLLTAAVVSGCSSGGSGVSTAAILGNAPTPPPAAGAAPGAEAGVAPAAVVLPPASNPTERAFQVGTVTARAAKCGYNFDGPKLKAAYMAHEIGLGASNDDMVKIQKIYDVAYNGVAKAATDEANYCSERKTAEIKNDLGRLLAGDFEPPKKVQAVQKKDDDEGFFGSLFGGNSEESGPSFGSGDWWDKQHEKAGG